MFSLYLYNKCMHINILGLLKNIIDRISSQPSIASPEKQKTKHKTKAKSISVDAIIYDTNHARKKQNKKQK